MKRMGLRKTLLVAGLGAAAAYFLDPVSGRERREKLQGMIDEAVQKAPNLPLPLRSSGESTPKAPGAEQATSPSTGSTSG